MSLPVASQRESRLLTGLFCAALIVHFYFATFHLTMPFMPGHEFRQAQTAIISYYIDQQNNFSLQYETPILGKPWVSILLEVPIYEWAVVGLSRLTGQPHFVAARCISLTCFYLSLPALYLLLGRFALPRPRRLLVLALILTCPLYIFYSRAFLIDAMEFMCCAWFLLGFVRTMDERRWSWLALTIVAGTGAALIKSAALAVWLLPAAGYGAWQLWRDLKARSGWRAPLRTVLWGAATVGVALGALRWWILYSDPIKAAHPSAWIFTSANLSLGNWGLFDFKAWYAASIWNFLLAGWEMGIMSRWIIAAGLLTGVAFLKPVRWRVLGISGVFFLAQFLFPYAYAYQDYYYYSCAVFVLVALGFVLHGLLDSRLPRWVCGLAIVGLISAQLWAYWQKGYYEQQSVESPGSYSFTNVLRELTPKHSVIIVAGADWAAMTPLYAQRKALMIRNGLEYDHAYLKRAFDDLADEDVSALVIWGKTRKERPMINLAAAKFGFDPEQPTFSADGIDVYISRLYLKGVQIRMMNSRRYPDLKLPPMPNAEAPAKQRFSISPSASRFAFTNILPGPYQAQFEFGVDWIEHGDTAVLSAHPNADLWLRPPADATEIIWRYGIFPGAYEQPGKMTNGVEFIVEGEMPDGEHRPVYYQLLDPTQNPQHRGDQKAVIPYQPRPGESLRFSTRTNGNSAFDWAYWISINVK